MRKIFQNLLIRYALPLGLLILSGCSEPELPIDSPVRSIKSLVVSTPASGQVRNFAGKVQAADSTTLSFEVSGRVDAVHVDIGSMVEVGDILAELDREPFLLNVKALKAELKAARANLRQKELEHKRKAQLFEKQWVSDADFQQSLAAYESAEGQVEVASAKLALAQRDLNNTAIKAPFAGVIATRSVQPYQEVQASQPLLELNAQGAFEVQVNIPESLIGKLALGMPASVSSPSLTGELLEARLTRIGSTAQVGNAYPVVFSLIQAPAGIRDGMTAEVSLVLDALALSTQAFLVPLTAIVPGDAPNHGYVFRFNPQTSQVKKVAVKGGSIQDNQVVVREGLSAGDIIAVAGVTFLSDGQQVKLMSTSPMIKE